MQNKKSIVLSILATLLLSGMFVSIAQMGFAEANFTPGSFAFADFSSPVSASYIYQNTTIDISFSYCTPNDLTTITSFSYSLDGTANSTLLNTKTFGNYTLRSNPNVYFPNYYIYSVSKPLENLSNGNHTLRVYVHFANSTVRQISDDTFTVDTTFQSPQLTILSPLNQTYSTNQVQFSYSINSPVVWAFYSIDTYRPQDHNWTKLNGNLTLTDLAEGTHAITISISSEASQHTGEAITGETVYFTVYTTQTGNLLTDSYLMPTVAAAITSIAIVGVAVMLVLKKRQ